MDPVAFRIFGIEIMWYAVLIMLGVVLGLILTRFNTTRKELNLDFDVVMDAFLYAFPLALIGARLYYVAFEWDLYRDNLAQILNVRGGGLAIHGGLIGALIGVLIYKFTAKKSTGYILNHADAVAPGLILAQATGRWGNFINKEAHGGPMTEEFIARFPQFIQDGMFINGQYYHPTFLYESVWNVLICIVLMVLFWKRRKNHEGTIVAWYLILYSLGRFFIEGLRTDSLYVGPLRTAQVISVIMMAIGLVYLLYKYRSKPVLPAADRGSAPPPSPDSPETPVDTGESAAKPEERLHTPEDVSRDNQD